MNTPIGVLCEVISVVSAVEKEGLVTSYTKVFLEQLFEDCGIQINDYTMLSKTDVDALIDHPDCAKSLGSVEVDVIALIDFSASLFREPSARLSFVDFVELILSLRGTNTARVKDIMDLRKYMFSRLEHTAEVRHQLIKSRVQDIETILYRMAVTIHPDLKKILKPPTESEEPVACSRLAPGALPRKSTRAVSELE
mmetsp:Transcript_24127/g.42616  ORF Transcript_24127/g.42616 Transcript_24127/m.42616 type:complete len:196 (+) Transcript_24127:1-588(+)